MDAQDPTTIRGVRIRPIRGPDFAESIVRARKEVILCSGAFGSAQLLMLSGIGPSKDLDKLNIPLVQELPVGQQLKDHTFVSIMLEVPITESIHLMYKTWMAIWQFVLYLVLGTGVLLGGISARSIFVRTTALDDKTLQVQARDEQGADNMDPLQPRNVPDVEIMMVPVSTMERAIKDKGLISLIVCLVQPESVGRLELVSTNPQEHLRVFYPYFTDQKDLVTARKALRFTMRLVQEFLENSGYPYKASLFMGPTVNRYSNSALLRDTENLDETMETIPPRGSKVAKKWNEVTDEELDEYIYAIGATGLHFSCTCRMSLNSAEGVVDQKLRVHGLKNLRVADASVFPKLPSGHTQAPAMMVGARCADFVKARWQETSGA